MINIQVSVWWPRSLACSQVPLNWCCLECCWYFRGWCKGTRSELQRHGALRGCPNGTICSSSPHLPREEVTPCGDLTAYECACIFWYYLPFFFFFFFKCIIAKLQNPQICVYYSNNLNMYSYLTIYRTLLPCKWNPRFFVVHSFS